MVLCETVLERASVSEILLNDEEVTISEIQITDRRFYNLISSMDESERPAFILKSLRVGAEILQRENAGIDVNYVRAEFDNFKKEVESQMDSFFSERGQLITKLDEYLGEQGKFEQALDKHFGEKGGAIYNVLDPNDSTTILGQFKTQIQSLLDLNNKDSSFGQLKNYVETGFTELNTKIDVTKAESKAREAERSIGTAKGRDFEEYVTESLDIIAKHFGDEITHVGKTRGATGDKGDIIIRLNKEDMGGVDRFIVVECKNRSITMSGKGSFLDELNQAKENRSAHYSIGAIHETYVPNSVGVFRRYDASRIICSVP